MGKYSYRLIDFLPFDYAGVERYLEKMAAKGLRLVSAETIPCPSICSISLSSPP